MATHSKTEMNSARRNLITARENVEKLQKRVHDLYLDETAKNGQIWDLEEALHKAEDEFMQHALYWRSLACR